MVGTAFTAELHFVPSSINIGRRTRHGKTAPAESQRANKSIVPNRLPPPKYFADLFIMGLDRRHSVLYICPLRSFSLLS